MEILKNILEEGSASCNLVHLFTKLALGLPTQAAPEKSAPQYWAIGDYKMVECEAEHADNIFVRHGLEDNSLEEFQYEPLSELLHSIKTNYLTVEYFTQETIDEFAMLEWYDTLAIEHWLQQNFDSRMAVIPMREIHFIYPQTLSSSETKVGDILSGRSHWYSKKSHVFPIVTWGNKNIETIFGNLAEFDWDQLKGHQTLKWKI